jgi:magnesium transporter
MSSSETETNIGPEPWQQLELIVDSGNVEHLEAFLNILPPGEMTYTIARLEDEHRKRLLSMINPEMAADLLEHLEDEHAADVLEELPEASAAAIVDEMDSDDQADVLGEMDEQEQEAILEKMAPEEAADARRLLAYEPDCAGGLMATEFLVYTGDRTTRDVIADMKLKADSYAEVDVQYIHVLDADGHLTGVVRLRDLVLAPEGDSLETIMIKQPRTIKVDADLEYLEDIFDRYDFRGAPVVDEQDKLIGIIYRSAIEEALGERAEEQLMRFGGIIGGEELRSMPTVSRTARRLAFLVPNCILLLLSVSIIALYEDVIEQTTALAVFLPLVVGLSGSAGNQAVAVSIRELALGLVRSQDVTRVLLKEIKVGLFNGIIIGAGLVLLVTLFKADLSLGLFQADFSLGLVVGITFAVTSVVATALGGIIPLVLRSIRLDPAMASGPVVTTLVDMCGFFVLLNLAQVLIKSAPVVG